MAQGTTLYKFEDWSVVKQFRARGGELKSFVQEEYEYASKWATHVPNDMSDIVVRATNTWWIKPHIAKSLQKENISDFCPDVKRNCCKFQNFLEEPVTRVGT